MAMAKWALWSLSYLLTVLSYSVVFRNILSKVENLERIKLFEADFTLFS